MGFLGRPAEPNPTEWEISDAAEEVITAFKEYDRSHLHPMTVKSLPSVSPGRRGPRAGRPTGRRHRAEPGLAKERAGRDRGETGLGTGREGEAKGVG